MVLLQLSRPDPTSAPWHLALLPLSNGLPHHYRNVLEFPSPARGALRQPLQSLRNCLFDVLKQSSLIWVAGNAWEGFTSGVVELPSPILKRKSSTSIACVVSEAAIRPPLLSKEFEIKKSATSPWKAGQHGLPSGLVLIAMCELDVDVLERNYADVNYYIGRLESAE
jgi:hypothetical protein